MATGRADRLAALKREIHGSYGFWGAHDLHEAVSAALRVGAPEGDPARLRELADFHRRLAVAADEARGRVTALGRGSCPRRGSARRR